MAFHDLNNIIRAWHQDRARNAYRVDWTAFDAPVDHVLYIPVNRLRTPYQTKKATNWDKVQENVNKMTNFEALAPVVIGYDYDVHDGHHRLEASKLMEYTHVPCIVGGNDPGAVRRAIEEYQTVWKSFGRQLEKAVIMDPTGGPFNQQNRYMYRGIGQKELDFIQVHGYIASKGKGNDDDKEKATCFSALYQQARGYAKSNYSLYNESAAYVIALPKPDTVKEDEHGEIVVHARVPIHGMRIEYIPNE